MTEFVQHDPVKFIMDKPLTSNPLIKNKECLLVISYVTCEKVAKSRDLFSKLPSLLIIRPETIENEELKMVITQSKI